MTLKRTTDIFGSIAGLLLIAPLAPLIALAIKLEDHGSILVKLPRISEGHVIFVYKFRSMVTNAHLQKSSLSHLNERIDGPFFKIKDDPRLTRIGKFLRKFRLDEFPQLWNVLKGELSLVGPRPHEPEEVILYPEKYQHIVFAKSGATGLSQVNGASSLPFLEELELDNLYLEQWSLKLDAHIIAQTIKIIFTDSNAV